MRAGREIDTDHHSAQHRRRRSVTTDTPTVCRRAHTTQTAEIEVARPLPLSIPVDTAGVLGGAGDPIPHVAQPPCAGADPLDDVDG
jgi:hypothetical protein